MALSSESDSTSPSRDLPRLLNSLSAPSCPVTQLCRLCSPPVCTLPRPRPTALWAVLGTWDGQHTRENVVCILVRMDIAQGCAGAGRRLVLFHQGILESWVAESSVEREVWMPFMDVTLKRRSTDQISSSNLDDSSE